MEIKRVRDPTMKKMGERLENLFETNFDFHIKSILTLQLWKILVDIIIMIRYKDQRRLLVGLSQWRKERFLSRMKEITRLCKPDICNSCGNKGKLI